MKLRVERALLFVVKGCLATAEVTLKVVEGIFTLALQKPPRRSRYVHTAQGTIEPGRSGPDGRRRGVVSGSPSIDRD